MKDNTKRILPLGIQSFKEIRKEGLVYIDKTDLIWQLANRGKKYNYLSRPRRFGKSLLVDTIQAYFEGEKDLFEGLKIMQIEKEWTKHPVIRFDMSRGGDDAASIKSYLNITFNRYEKQYGITPEADVSLTDRFDNIIQTACKQTGQQVVILVDEYDSPLQHSWKTPEHDACTSIYKSVFAILKADDEFERFVFITGITKFTQISLFSVLNNLSNISFDPQFAAICGITKDEAASNLMPEIEKMGEANDWTPEETIQQLKAYYDGYHFSRRNMVDIFNPFSLLNALADSDLQSYWAASGATSMLPKFVDDMEIHLPDFENCCLDRVTIETSDVTGGGSELFLYQSGYLTIKGYEDGVYLLGIPNHEVRQALYKVVVPALTMKTNAQAITAQSKLMLAAQRGDLDEAKKALKSLISDVPYSNKKLECMNMEERYRLIISTIFNAIGFKVEVERMISTGRIDMVIYTRRIIYILELKLSNNGGMKAAENQINDRNYTKPFLADGRMVIALAVELDDMGKGLIDWKEVK